MTILETSLNRIFGAIRQHKAEKTKSTWTQYRELVGRFAAGDDVDIDEIEITLDAAGKTEADLEKDIKLVHKAMPTIPVKTNPVIR